MSSSSEAGSLQSKATEDETSADKLEKQKKVDPTKIDIILKATSDAPILKRHKWTVPRNKKIGWVQEFLTHHCGLKKPETLFLYVNQSYSPAPDEVIENLYNCFGSGNKLELHYSKNVAWG